MVTNPQQDINGDWDETRLPDLDYGEGDDDE